MRWKEMVEWNPSSALETSVWLVIIWSSNFERDSQTLTVKVFLIVRAVTSNREKMDWQIIVLLLVLFDGSNGQTTDCNPFVISR